jgi:NAD(P) transhydrogenase subunit alpha
MRRGAVVVDLAAENGGNCEGSRPGETVDVNGVTIVGPSNVAATMGADASRMYAKNVEEVLKHLAPAPKKKGEPAPEGPPRLVVDLADEITGASMLVHAGERRTPGTASAPTTTPAPATTSKAPEQRA